MLVAKKPHPAPLSEFLIFLGSKSELSASVGLGFSLVVKFLFPPSLVVWLAGNLTSFSRLSLASCRALVFLVSAGPCGQSLRIWGRGVFGKNSPSLCP